MSAPLAFVDTETTGLDPDRHEVWEVGLILRDGQREVEYCWQLPADLGKADAMALGIGQWYQRRLPWPYYDELFFPDEKDRARAESALSGLGKPEYVVPESLMGRWAALFAELTDGAHLVGAVISFDEERLRRLLRKHQACPTWHYHLVDVEALAAGWLASQRNHRGVGVPTVEIDPEPPWDSSALSAAVGVDPDGFDRHTALGDARWAKAIYDAVIG